MYQIQYRVNGTWVNGNSYKTQQEADAYAKRTGYDYQIKKMKR